MMKKLLNILILIAIILAIPVFINLTMMLVSFIVGGIVVAGIGVYIYVKLKKDS